MKYVFLLIATLWSIAVQAQRTAHGLVLDQTAEPLIGGTVKVYGAATMAKTDEKGRFTISLGKGESTLVFEYAGFITQMVELTTARTDDMKVVLQPNGPVVGDFVVTAVSLSKYPPISVCNYGLDLVVPTTQQIDPKDTLYAKANANGYDLINTAGRIVLTLQKTSKPNHFASASGVVFLQKKEWVFEFYKNGQLISQKLSIKF